MLVASRFVGVAAGSTSRTRKRNGLARLKSQQLRDCLRKLSEGSKADESLFVTERGARLHPDNFVKRVLKPVVNAFGLKGGLHAFRHGNATAMDFPQVPMATRQARLGHVDEETTMTTHLNSDGHRVAEELDKHFRLPDLMTAETAGRVM